jgi:hypothetical protein
MTVELTGVEDAGNHERERVVIKITADDDIGRYAIFRAVARDGRPLSGNIPYVYWFADTKVKAGDFIVVYTKSGLRSEKPSENGTTSRFFYWGLPSQVWLQGTVPVLVSTSSWLVGKPILATVL